MRSIPIKNFIVLNVIFCSILNLQGQQGNTLLGNGAGANITTADSVVAIGVDAAHLTTQGARHVLLGTKAGYNINYNPSSTVGNPTGSGGSVFLGYLTGYHTISADDNVFIGDQAGYSTTTGNDNVFVGSRSGLLNTTGYDNVFLGKWSGAKNTSASSNLFLGNNSGYENTTGSNNTFIGYKAGENNNTGFYNTFVGYRSGVYNTTGNSNTSAGYFSQFQNDTGENNTIIGYYAGYFTEFVSNNTFIGAYAGHLNNATNGTDNAKQNTYFGYSAGESNRSGSNNTGIGSFADFSLSSTDISNAVFVGSGSIVERNGVTIIGRDGIASGTNSIAIGKESNVMTDADNSIAIGYQSSVNNLNSINIGNAMHTSIGGAVNWTATSDRGYKSEILENVVGLDFINALTPVTYRFDTRKLFESFGGVIPDDLLSAIESKNHMRFTGFLAQDVEIASKDTDFEFSGVDKRNTDLYGLRYAEFVVPLVRAVQELSTKIEDLEDQTRQQDELLIQYEAVLAKASKKLQQLKRQSYVSK